MPRREDLEAHKGHVVALGKNEVWNLFPFVILKLT
jgi:hypothetical protein